MIPRFHTVAVFSEKTHRSTPGRFFVYARRFATRPDNDEMVDYLHPKVYCLPHLGVVLTRCQSGTRVCKTCRPWQMPQDEHSLATIDLDTAKNELSRSLFKLAGPKWWCKVALIRCWAFEHTSLSVFLRAIARLGLRRRRPILAPIDQIHWRLAIVKTHQGWFCA